jgi:PAS domain S-box-containing protein
VENRSTVPVVSLEWEQQYARLCEAARTFIFRVNPEGHLKILTPPLGTLAGWPARDWATRPVVDLLHPDDVAAGKQAIARVWKGEVPEPFEIRLRTPTGSYRHVLCAVLPEEDGAHRVQGLLGLANDVTGRVRQVEKALREREEQQRFLLETAQAVVWRGDASTLRFTFVSREAQALLGYPVERWTTEPDFFRERVHPEDRDWAVASRASAGRESRDHQVEFRMLAANGRVVWVRDIVRIVRDAQGRGLESVGVMIDVTERRGAEEELRQSREQLRDLSAHVEWAREEERATISRSIHDDLGQALTALKFELAALRQGAAGGAPSAELVARIDDMSELVMGTVDHVRRIAKELRPGLLDDLGLVAALEWQVQEFQDRTRIECRLHSELGDVRLPRPVATTCFRTVQEALTNVARHAAARRAEIRISRQSGRLILEISDDGRGIDQTELRSARSLGLLGMKERARRLGGDVSVTGTPGRGTVVTLSVPWTERASQDLP